MPYNLADLLSMDSMDIYNIEDSDLIESEIFLSNMLLEEDISCEYIQAVEYALDIIKVELIARGLL